MNIPYVMKKCTKCGRWLVASTVNFHRQKRGRYGLRGECKECVKQYHKANEEKIAKQQKQWREANPEYNKQWRGANKGKLTEYGKKRYLVNRDDKLEYQKQYYENNKEKRIEYQKEYDKQYRQTPQGQAARFKANNRRRHKKETQGTGVTKEQWLEMMQYFDWRCAYSGERLTDKTRSGDHIVPIDAGGDDMVWNMVPMTRSLNSSKWKKDMLEWYKKQPFYSEARLAKIYEWQEYARKKWEK